ncbi:MAG: hypothetical protein IKV90_04980 [Clostridia bacterium]|nr:hypothetical protein [Clostridia bacterium]
MAKQAHSRVRKRRRGCLGGCLVKIILLLGLGALLFVGACLTGIVRIDETTGAPQISLENFALPEQIQGIGLPQIDLSGMLSGLSLEGLSVPSWPYGVEKSGLTVKTLRAGAGEAVLVCCDGYMMLLGGGENGLLTAGQLLLCGAGNLSAVAAMDLYQGRTGGMETVLSLMKPTYLLYPDSQTKSAAFNSMIERAKKSGTQLVAPEQGLTFSLGRATVRFVGPKYKHHTDERDDGLSVRIDYGDTSVLVMGGVTQAAEREIISSGAPMDADVLICGLGGSEEATSGVLVTAVTPKIALMTGENPANAVKVRLERVGCKVYTAEEHGVMTVHSDGREIHVTP